MNGFDFIAAKQTAWAKRHQFRLIGSKGNRGRKLYVEQLDDNLFESLLPEVKEAFLSGDGGELTSRGETPAKMQALHSSSALSVNIFQYWKNTANIPKIASACGLCRKDNPFPCQIKFEQKFEIHGQFPRPSNLDVVIENTPEANIKVFGIECKYSEAYSTREHSGLKERYLHDIPQLWEDIPHTHKLAHRISPSDNEFVYLHPAQLIKHILGLKKAYGKSSFRLLYLWYDVYGHEGYKHREEIAKFHEIVTDDKILFHSLSYQELIVALQRKYPEEHMAYLNYITGRYL